MSEFKIILAKPRGFCAGVDRAIDIVEKALHYYGAPIYVKHEIVHNKFVVKKLEQKGAIFVEELSEIPENSRVIFSAHGVSPMVKNEAKLKFLKVLDATCPLVTKVHKEAVRFAINEYKIILIGHKDHVEVVGTVGHAPDDITVISTVDEVASLSFSKSQKLAYITQTTLSVHDTTAVIEALRQKFPQIEAAPKEDICYATTNRQNAVIELCKVVQAVLVVGSDYSSNTMRLLETAIRHDRPAYLIATPLDIKPEMFIDLDVIGITAGASAPEELVLLVLARINEIKKAILEEKEFTTENVSFTMPYELRQLAKAIS